MTLRWLLLVALAASLATALVLLIAAGSYPRPCLAGGSAVGPVTYNADTGTYEGETTPATDCFIRQP